MRGCTETDVGELLAEVERVSSLPMERAETLPPEVYTSEAFFEWECGRIFRSEWLCVGHESQVPAIGDFLKLDLLGEPLVLVRGKDGIPRVLSRVCPHRAMDIMPAGFGRGGDDGTDNVRLFLCPYHSWTFDLDGKLKGCPEMGKAEGFCRDDVGLGEFRTEVWEGFVFVNLDGEAEEGIGEQYAEFGEAVKRWDLGSMEVVFERSWDCPFNWKVLAENFMESYHHAGAHAKTLQTMMPARDTWTERERAHFIRCHLPYKDELRGEASPANAFPVLDALEGEERFEWGLYLGYPTFMFVALPDGAVWYRLQPVSAGRCELLTTVMLPRSARGLADFEERYAKLCAAALEFHLEDMEMCTAVQRGLGASGGVQRGRLSHLEMPVWLIQRYVAARARGTWPGVDREPAGGQR